MEGKPQRMAFIFTRESYSVAIWL